MAMKGNRYIVSVGGRLGQDPKTFGDGGVSASLAVDVPVRRNKKVDYETYWHNLTAFGRIGERLLELRKGDYLIIDGTRSIEEFTSRDTGELVQKDAIFVTHIQEEYESDRQGGGGGGGGQRRRMSKPAESEPPADDLPY